MYTFISKPFYVSLKNPIFILCLVLVVICKINKTLQISIIFHYLKRMFIIL